MGERTKQLAEDLRADVFEMMDAETSCTGIDAGQIAHVVEIAFLAACNRPQLPRWNRGDTFTPKGKIARQWTVSDVVRTIRESGGMTVTYSAQREFMGQTVTQVFNDTTIARGRTRKDGSLMLSGETE